MDVGAGPRRLVLAASATHVASWRTNKQQLLRDGLTGLPSRLLLMSRLEASRTTSRATCVLRETVHRECRDNNGLDNRGNSPSADCVDQTTGTGTARTANTWTDNVGVTSLPPGLCQPPPP